MHRIAVLWASVLVASAASASAPTVDIDAGKVRGGICKDNEDVAYFKAIPFANPPVNSLRFAPPSAYSKKFPSDGLDATQTAPTCIQFGSQFAETGLTTSEDCLYLDVWAPANATKDSGLPVRVWLYGGGNSDGSISDPLYDGCPVAATGAVMVSINYRLGPLGFLSLKDAGFGGNQGIQDALLGLQWVQDNIEAFGGDTKKVLFHGESAGAIDSFMIATLEQAPKLFSSAIFQSGGGLPATTQQGVENISTTFAQGIKCNTNDKSCLQQKSVDDLKTAFTNLPEGSGGYSPDAPNFGPCVDGKVIPVQPAGQAVRVPSVFGSNLQEGTLFTFAQYISDPGALNASSYDSYLQEQFGDKADDVKKQYPLDMFSDTEFPPIYAISQIVTASTFKCPARRGLAKAAKNGVNVWTYVFAHKPKCSWEQQIPDYGVALLGATHSSEIPFVLGHTDNLPLPNGTCEMTSDEKNISSFMNNAWTAMAKNQKPADNQTWPAWTDAQSSMGINIVNSSAAGFVNYTECDLWDRIDAALSANSTGGNSSSSGNSTGGGGGGGGGSGSGGSGGSATTSSSGPSHTSGANGKSVYFVNTALVLGWSAALAMLLW